MLAKQITPLIRRKAEESRSVEGNGNFPDIPPRMDARIQSLRGSGHVLPEQLRSYFEPRFAYDFKSVRVHTDSDASETARAMNARAFTIGQDIVFGEREYSPETDAGRRLLAHELTHVMQQNIDLIKSEHMLYHNPIVTAATARGLQRQGQDKPDAGVPDISPAAPHQEKISEVSLEGENGIRFAGLVFLPDTDKLRELLEKYISTNGTGAARRLIDKLQNALPSLPGGVPERDPEVSLYARLDTIMPLLRNAFSVIESEHSKFVSDFEKQAKANVTSTLAKSEEIAKREAVKYGISEERILKGGFACAKADYDCYETIYHMQTGTPASTGLQKAAEVLLTRRQNIERLEREQRMATHFESDPKDPKGQILVPDEPQFSKIGHEIQSEREKYLQIRSAVASDYPVLAAVSELDKGTGDLETIAKKGAGDESAKIIKGQIAERLINIAKVRDNLEDKSEVNIWRLPPVVDVTGAQLGSDSVALKKRWVAEQVEDEKPGLLGTIALLIFNVLAIAFAPATGGISLAVAAGVNLAATGIEVQEFMMKKALAGTSFDKAKALSQDEPSLFWLAFAIVGTAVDVAGAAGILLKTFRNLAPLAKAAEVAKEGKEAEEAIETLTMAARKEGGAQLAEQVAANIKRTRGGESVALEAAGASKTEREALETAVTMTKKEAADIIGPSIRTASGDLKLTRTGRIVSCTNPCEIFRDKFAAVLAKDADLEKELAGLEKRAVDAAEKAKIGGAKAEEAAETVKSEAATLEKKLQESARKLVLADQLAKLDEIRKLFPKLESLDVKALERVLALAPNEGHIKGQLLEEFLNLRMAKPEGIAANVPVNILKQVEKDGGKLEFIPGYAIRDADGSLVSDGIIGYWKDERFNIVTFFESKGGAASGRGLRRKWTGIPKAERVDILKEAQIRGIVSYREVDQNAAEALSEAVQELKKTNPAKYSSYTIDDVIKEFPGDVEKAWAKLPQSEAGQITKTTERLVPNAGQSFTELEFFGKPVKVTTGGGTPHAVGVLPSDVAEKSLEQTMKESGIKSFERLKDVPVNQAELDRMSTEIARISGVAKPKKP
jgi:hypothetical protein